MIRFKEIVKDKFSGMIGSWVGGVAMKGLAWGAWIAYFDIGRTVATGIDTKNMFNNFAF